ncbi:hypothetical protein B0A55_04939 [Friedmanniomyces simplex]|uniref:Ureidoglycolate hydrolase n=1 Tax=Friedmanniomyces simplex TaxID=329884 RepID=A0A4U0XDT8_9PEZI|nr:hypothetical protein B0A55_04939 [Friedmanniomyces simplex]
MVLRISASSRVIRAEVLDPTAFAPFGEVIQNPGTHGDTPNLRRMEANQGSATKWLDVTKMRNWYGLGQSRKLAEVAMNMFDSNETLEPAYPVPPPRPKRSLRERLLGARPNLFTNDFSPSTTPAEPTSSGSRPKGPGLPDLENIRAFIARGDQAITYGAGTWHAPMVVLGERAIDFVVAQYMNGVAIEDCQEVELGVESDGDGLAVDVEGSNGQGTARARL